MVEYLEDLKEDDTVDLKNRKIIIFRGEHRNEVLAYLLAPKITAGLIVRGYDANLETMALELTRHKKNLNGNPVYSDYEEDYVLSYVLKDLHEKNKGTNLAIFNIHNYDLKDMSNPFLNDPKRFCIGNEDHSRFYRLEKADIYSFYCIERSVVVEIPSPMKLFPRQLRRKLVRRVIDNDLPVSWYERYISDLDKAKKLGFNEDVMIDKVIDLIIKTPDYLREVYKLKH